MRIDCNNDLASFETYAGKVRIVSVMYLYSLLMFSPSILVTSSSNGKYPHNIEYKMIPQLQISAGSPI